MVNFTTDDPSFFILHAIERPIAVPPVFKKVAKAAGAAILLSQAWYWTKTLPSQRNGWFYKSQKEWEDETGLTRYEQETARRQLIKLGILEEQRKGNPARLWFRLRQDVLATQIAASLQSSMQDRCNQECDDAAYKSVEPPQSLITESTADSNSRDSGDLHEKPAALIDVWAEVCNEGRWPANKGKALRHAKVLSEGGITTDDARSLIDWLIAQPWVKGGIDLGLMETQVDKWQASKVVKAKPRRHDSLVF